MTEPAQSERSDLELPRRSAEHDAAKVAPEPPLDSGGPAFRAWAAALLALAGAWLVLLAIPTLAGLVQLVDDRVWELVVSAEQPALVVVAKVLDGIGGTLAMSALVVAVAVVLAWRRRWPAFTVWLVAMTVSQGLNVLVKELYQRPRPPLGLIEEHSWSFMSGHSLTATAVAITLVLVWTRAGERRRGWLIIAVVYALVMGASRIYLRVHWFSDAFAGVALGAAIALTVALIASWRDARDEPVRTRMTR